MRKFGRADAWFLFTWTVDEKEPSIEAARTERRRDPTTGEREIARVQVETVMREHLRKGHALRSQIIQERVKLPFGQRICAVRNQHARLFKQFAGSATDHRRRLRITTIFNARLRILRVALPARKSIEAAEKSHALAALRPINLRRGDVIRVCTNENDGGGVFRHSICATRRRGSV